MMTSPPGKSKRVLFHPYLGQRVKYLRERLGKTQSGIETALDMSNGMVSQIENSKLGVELTKLSGLAEELQVEPETLAYPGNIPNEKLDFLNKLYVVLKNRDKTSRLTSIEDLVEKAYEEVTK